MPTPAKPSGQPIYNRAAITLPKPSTEKQNASLDAQADEIRKAWLQSPPNRK